MVATFRRSIYDVETSWLLWPSAADWHDYERNSVNLSSRKFVFSLLLVPLFLSGGCNKKKATIPPHGQAPTLAVVLPDELPLTQAPEEPSPKPVEPAPVTPTKSKPKKASRTSTAKVKKTAPPPSNPTPPPAQQPSTENQTVATLHPRNPVPEPIPETALGAAVSSSKLQQQREETARMIDSTENALKGINRSLSEDEKSVKSQIESFLQQSRKATVDGDYERAYNLAKKAQLLAEALVKK